MIINIDSEKDIQSINNKLENGKWFVLYHADWCGWCKKMMPDWEKLESKYNGNKNINLAKINSDQVKNVNIASNDEIRGYPTIKLYINGKSQDYQGERNTESFVQYLENYTNMKGGKRKSMKSSKIFKRKKKKTLKKKALKKKTLKKKSLK